MKPLPLRTTLTLVFGAVLALILTAEGYAHHAALKRQLDTSVTMDLDDKARALHGYLRFSGESVALAYDEDDADEAAFIADATRYYQIYDGVSGRLLRQSPGLESLGLKYTPNEVRDILRSPGMRDVQTDRGRLRLTSTVITAGDRHTYLVQVGTLLDRLDASLADFDRVLAVGTLIGVALAAVLGFVFSGWALAPLKRLAGHAVAIDITNLRARLPLRGAGDELDHVAAAFNDSLMRLERSVNEMRQFSAAVAHELRTPLAILRGEAEMALATPQTADAARDRLASQIDEYDRLTRLINQILTLARAEAGEIAINKSAIDLTALAAEMCEQVDPLAEASGIALSHRAEPALQVSADKGWIERLLLILLDNAIKFTPRGGQVTIVASRAHDHVELTVEDTGIGMPAEVAARIFEPFYRGTAGHKPEPLSGDWQRAEGAGIGLALARWIADAHGARLTVTSRPNAGSAFTLTFPAAVAH